MKKKQSVVNQKRSFVLRCMLNEKEYNKQISQTRTARGPKKALNGFWHPGEKNGKVKIWTRSEIVLIK